MMIDFNHRNPTEWINFDIDQSLAVRHATEPAREYLGASILGHECDRYLQYQYFKTPCKPFSPRTLRIFQRGHVFEDIVRNWLCRSGFLISDDQKGFEILDGKIRGHIDGQIFSGSPYMQYPCLWECKSVGGKSFRKYAKEGIRKGNWTYYVQVQLYMAYMELYENPCLFTVLNCDTMELYHELIPFDSETAQRYSDRAVYIDSACKSGTRLPGLSDKGESYYVCKYCNYGERCYA